MTTNWDIRYSMMYASKQLASAWKQWTSKGQAAKSSDQLSLWYQFSDTPRSGARWSAMEFARVKNALDACIMKSAGVKCITPAIMCVIADELGRTPTGIHTYIMGCTHQDRAFRIRYVDAVTYFPK